MSGSLSTSCKDVWTFAIPCFRAKSSPRARSRLMTATSSTPAAFFICGTMLLSACLPGPSSAQRTLMAGFLVQFQVDWLRLVRQCAAAAWMWESFFARQPHFRRSSSLQFRGGAGLPKGLVGKLKRRQTCIEPTRANERAMRALSHDAPFIHDNDAIGLQYRGEAMSDNDRCTRF